MTLTAETSAPCRYRLEAFGLQIASERALPGAEMATGVEHPGTSVRWISTSEFEALPEPLEELRNWRAPEAQAHYVIQRTAHDYVFDLSYWGRYLCSLDGRSVSCERGGAPDVVQQRFLLAQVLPLAALLQGREVLHAGAIAGSRGAAAFLGTSGAGKTTLIGRLVCRGMTFFTDDVLSIEEGRDAPLVHPGPPFMAVAPEDEWVLERAAGRLGESLGVSDKVHATPTVARQSLPLRGIYHLEAGAPFSIAPADSSDARPLLASGFAPYLSTAERLRRHLGIAQLIDRTVPQFKLRLPRDERFDSAVDELLIHLRDRID